MDSRTWRTWLISAVLSGAVALGVVAATSQDSEAAAVASTPATPVTAATAAVETVQEPSDEGLDAIDTTASYAVAVVDLDSGASLVHGDETFDTASIVKVDILAALLHQQEQAGTTMSATEREQAAAMIQHSDNDAATALFEAVGGRAGLEAFNALIGLDDTVVGSDGNWGLTQTTAVDQIRLLQVAVGDDTVLSASSRARA